MNPDRWEQIQKAYLAAVRLTPEEQTPYLETICVGDLPLQREVESLLGYKNKVGNFLEETAIEVLIRDYGLKPHEAKTARVEDLVGTIIDHRYVVSKHIGTGGMGDVYRAEHRLLRRPVAIKRLKRELRDRKEYRERFVAEARRAVLLDHENITEVKDVVEQSNEVFVIMEFIDGQTLRTRLEHPLNVDEFLPIASQCASALVAAHQERIIHLDIKPENIMLTGSNQVKVCDFGVAHQLPAVGDTRTEPTPRWTFAGTPAYMAPEVLESSQFDERADIFSLGLVFYEMLAGTHPFRSANLHSTTKRIVTESAPSLSQVNKKIPARLVHLIEKMLARNPAERIRSAAEVLRQLQIVRRRHRLFRDTLHNAAGLGASVVRKPAHALVSIISIIIFAIVIVGAVSYFVRGAPLPEKKMLVILPFRVIGQAGDERFYSQGVSEILTAKLAELSVIPNLLVAPTSLVREKQINSLEKARAEFGANLVLDGTFQFSRDQVRFSYALTDIATRRDVARNEKTIPIADPFKLQDGVVQDLLGILRVKLTTEQQEAVAVYGTYDFKAFSLYTSGMGALANYQELENVEKAINLFSQAVQQDDRYSLAHAALGRAYWQKFSKVKDAAFLDLSRTSCEKAASLNVRLSEAQVCLGRIFQEKGDNELAVEYFQRAIDYSSTNDDAYRAKGSALESLGRYDEAEKTYQQAIDGRPQYWAGHSWIGVFYDRQHRYAEAINHFNTALALSPGNAQVCYSMALAYLDDSQYDNAIRLLHKAIDLGPYLEAPYGNLGLTYLRRGQFADAVAPLEKSASMSENYRSLGNLARIYWLVGRKDEARQKYELAIRDGEKQLKLNPGDPGIHLLVGRYYAMLGKKTEATSNLTEALAKKYDDPHYLLIAATAYVQLNDRGQALSLMERAIRPDYGPAHIQEEPELSVLKTEPRYIALLSSERTGDVKTTKGESKQ